MKKTLALTQPSPPGEGIHFPGAGEGRQMVGHYGVLARFSLPMNPLTPSLSPSDGERVAGGRVSSKFGAFSPWGERVGVRASV